MLFTGHQQVEADKAKWSKATRSRMLSSMVEQEELDNYSLSCNKPRMKSDSLTSSASRGACASGGASAALSDQTPEVDSVVRDRSSSAVGGGTGASLQHTSELAEHVQHSQFDNATELKIPVIATGVEAEADSNNQQDWSAACDKGWSCQCKEKVEVDTDAEMSSSPLPSTDVNICQTCAWEAANLLQLAGNQRMTKKLLTATRLRLEPMVAQWEHHELCPIQRRSKLHKKSVEYLNDSIQRQQNVFEIICLESKFGEGSNAVWLFKQFDGWLYNSLHHFLLFVFIMSEFTPSGSLRTATDISLMLAFTGDTIMLVWAKAQVHGTKLDGSLLFSTTGASAVINTAMWFLIMLDAVTGQDAYLGMCRPLMMILKAQIVRDSLRVLFKCIEHSSVSVCTTPLAALKH